MKFYHAGDKSKAACEQCKSLVTTTFAYRDVPFRHAKGQAKDLLVAVCDECGDVVSIPAQSTPAVREARNHALHSVEVKLPVPYVDMLNGGAYRIAPEAGPGFKKSLLAYYFRKYAQAPDLLEEAQIGQIASEIPLQRKAMKDLPIARLSFRYSGPVISDIDVLTDRLSINRTTLVACMARKVEQEIIEPEQPAELTTLRNIAAVVNA
ncbi:MAG: hypothetical protein L3J67_07905 [Hyphomicrobiaceae bacterium]|nr:hypothetical protein [Hyphomicrobiaceae bacterium]